MAEKGKNNTTSKKVKVIGNVPYFNMMTGEVDNFQVTEIEERDFNFTKVWMRSFLSTLDIVGNQKTRFAYWLIENLTKENLLTYTYRQMSDKSGISLGTVRDTMSILLDSNFIKRINAGCYIVNPDIAFKGTRNARMNILNKYNTAEYVPLTKEQKLNNIMQAINQLQAQAQSLVTQIQQEKGVMTDAEIHQRTDADSQKNELVSIFTSKSC